MSNDPNRAVKGKPGGKTGLFSGKVSMNKVETPGDILVTRMTEPAMLPDIMMAAAVVTDEGGTLCHAALVCMELGIPFVVGTKTATKVLRNGDFVEVNTSTGTVRVME